MARISGYLRIAAGFGLICAAGWCFESNARGQGAIAFTPQVGFVPNGLTLTVTPAVSADRRYVRLSVNPYFNTVNGFTTYTSQLGAVGGTGGGFGGGGGFAGMNGVMGVGGNTGMGSGSAFGQMGMPYTGTYTAGDYPFAPGGYPQGLAAGNFPAAGTGFDSGFGGAVPAMDGAGMGRDPFTPGQGEFSDADEAPRVRAAAPRSKSARRQTAARKPARRTSKATSRR